MSDLVTLKGIFFKRCYNFSRYYIGGWTLRRWVITLIIILPLLIWLNILPSGWIAIGIVGLFGLSLILGFWYAYRQDYFIFEPDSSQTDLTKRNHTSSILEQIQPFQQISLRATGTFTVEGKKRFYVEESATYQFFETRERAIMVAIPPEQFLWLARPQLTEVGWWYAFFRPEAIETLVLGTMIFGQKTRSALQLSYQADHVESLEILYLSFDNQAQREQILRDLLADLDHTEKNEG